VIDRNAFLAAVIARRQGIVDATLRLIAAPSPNPPLDSRAAASVAEALIREAVPDCPIEVIETGDDIVNLVAVLRGGAPGRRVVLSGHLDTYPVLEDLPWTVDPLKGTVRDGRIYGRGACDMKGGIAASIAAFAVLAQHRAHWPGEVVLALSGDEESMGERGAKWLLENRPEVRGDAVLIADVGSPDVLRFGEKGFLWFEVEAQGKPAHGAHVHLGENAIERLMAALQALFGLRGLPFTAPPAITAAIAKAAPISEARSAMPALLGDAVLRHHHDAVGIADGRQPVRDDQRRAPAARVRQRLLDRVRSRCRAPRSPRPGSGSAGSSGRCGRWPGAASARPRASRRARRPPCRAPAGRSAITASSLARRAPQDLGLAGAEPAIGDVLAHRAGEQEDILLHDADLPAQGGQRHVADIDAVDGDAPESTS
jgi:hypothetical protein